MSESPHKAAVGDVPLQSTDCKGGATSKPFDVSSMERWALRNPLVASFGFVALLFAIVLSLYTPSYETNDDVLMNMIASGTGVSIVPDEHLVFTNVAIGLLLKHLYTQAPSLPWYAIYLLSVNFLTQVAVFHALLTWRYSRSVLICYCLLFATVGVQLMTRLQFTSIAVWAAECGLFVVLNGLVRRQKGERAVGMLAAGMVVMVLGSLVRFDSYVAAMAISAAPLTILVWQLDRRSLPAHQMWKLALTLFVVTQVTAAGAHAAHLTYYNSDPAWHEFLAFNPYRVKFNDYCWTGYSEETRPVFEGVHWTENDHAMITKYFFDDPKIFGRKTLQPIIEGFAWGRNAVSLRKMAKWWMGILKNPLLWPIWMLIPFQVSRARNRRFVMVHFLILTVSIDLIVTGLMLLKNPPARVYYPLVAFQGLYLLFLMRFDESTSSNKNHRATDQLNRSPETSGFFPPAWGKRVCLAFAMLAIMTEHFIAFRESCNAVTENRRLHSDLIRIDAQSDELFICWGDRFPYESVLPLESPDRYRDLHLYCLGWLQQSPINDAVKRHFGISDLTLSMVNHPHVYLLGAGNKHRVQLDSELMHFQKFASEHYQMNLDWGDYFRGDHLRIYKPVSPVAEASNASVETRWR